MTNPTGTKNEAWEFLAKLVGARDLLFDRYPGDNDTKLKPHEKVYLNTANHCVVPVVNLYSCLTAENTKSVAKFCYGKKAGNIRIGINSFVTITGDDENSPNRMAALIRDGDGKPITRDDPRITVETHVARLAKGVPNPKVRPCIHVPWSVTFHFRYLKNEFISREVLIDCLQQAGEIVGLGTFRPMFGKFVVEISEV